MAALDLTDFNLFMVTNLNVWSTVQEICQYFGWRSYYVGLN